MRRPLAQAAVAHAAVLRGPRAEGCCPLFLACGVAHCDALLEQAVVDAIDRLPHPQLRIPTPVGGVSTRAPRRPRMKATRRALSRRARRLVEADPVLKRPVGRRVKQLADDLGFVPARDAERASVGVAAGLRRTRVGACPMLHHGIGELEALAPPAEESRVRRGGGEGGGGSAGTGTGRMGTGTGWVEGTRESEAEAGVQSTVPTHELFAPVCARSRPRARRRTPGLVEIGRREPARGAVPRRVWRGGWRCRRRRRLRGWRGRRRW